MNELQEKLEQMLVEQMLVEQELLEMDDWQLQCRRDLRDFGRSRLAQFGKAKPNRRRFVKPRLYWFRIRSFCVRSAYG